MKINPSLMANGKPFPILLVIGASTGGPLALSRILAGLPKNLSLAIVVIQHVDEKFIANFAHWLEKETHWPIVLAAAGDLPTPGKVLIPAKDQHLVIHQNGGLHYTSFPKDCPYCPSVDVFFHSLSQNWPQKSIAVVLTGMGNDGAEGLKALHDIGWHTIAEHEKSCVIYGMPRAAIEMGGAAEIVECSCVSHAIQAAYRRIVQK